MLVLGLALLALRVHRQITGHPPTLAGVGVVGPCRR